MKLNFLVNHQSCRMIPCTPTLVADTLHYFEAQFLFQSQSWDGLQKWAHFSCGETFVDALLDEADRIPESFGLNLAAGTWSVYVHGVADGEDVQRIVTDVCTFVVKPSGIASGELLPTAPSAGEQVALLAQKAVDIAQSVRDDADAGKFDGPQGPQGPVGEGGGFDCECEPPYALIETITMEEGATEVVRTGLSLAKVNLYLTIPQAETTLSIGGSIDNGAGMIGEIWLGGAINADGVRYAYVHAESTNGWAFVDNKAPSAAASAVGALQRSSTGIAGDTPINKIALYATSSGTFPAGTVIEVFGASAAG